MLGRRGADDGADPREARLAGELRGALRDQRRELLVQWAPAERRVLETGGTGVRGSDQQEDAGARRLGRLDQRVDGIAAEQRVGGEGVRAEAADRTPGSLGLAHERLAVGPRGDRHVTALAVGDHQQPGSSRCLADVDQRLPARCAEPLEAGELRLHRDASGARRVDQRSALLEHRGRGTIGAVGQVRPWRTSIRRVALTRALAPQLCRVRIEPQAHLAPALLDERPEPVSERRDYPPLTFFFSPEPAEKRGTLPPGMKIRSPVRGFTPCRGPRSATANLPKPVKLTSPPPWRTFVMASSTASTAWPASFLLPILLSPASTSRNSALVTSSPPDHSRSPRA